MELCLGEFAGFARKKDDYEKFDEEFGKCLKPGNHEDLMCGTKFAKLLQLSAPKCGDELTRLRKCFNGIVSRM